MQPFGRSGVDAVVAQRLRVGLAPALQVVLARIEPPALLASDFDDDVHVGMLGRLGVGIGVEGVLGHDVEMAVELLGGEVSHCPLDAELVGAFGHGEHEVVGLDQLALFLADEGAGVLPVVL